jgi:1-acyl-sn-glycerol-3-phosphate acyltransferase
VSVVAAGPALVLGSPCTWRGTAARWFRAAFQDLVLAPLVRVWCAPFQVSASRLPDQPVVFVANHASHLDTPAVLAALPRSVRHRLAIAAAEDYFYRSRLLGGLVGLGIGTFPFPRQGTLGIQRADARLAQGHSVLLFPEGTRSPDGCQQTFRHGVGHLLLETGAAAVPVAIVGTHTAWPKGARLPRRAPLCVHVGRPWTPPSDLPAAAIANELAARVAGLATRDARPCAPMRVPAT